MFIDAERVFSDNIVATTRNRKDSRNILRALAPSYTRETLACHYYLRNHSRPWLPSLLSSLDSIAIPKDKRIS
jgi:hypothetical protein